MSFKKNKIVNIIKLKDIDPIQAAYTLINHKLEKENNVIQKK